MATERVSNDDTPPTFFRLVEARVPSSSVTPSAPVLVAASPPASVATDEVDWIENALRDAPPTVFRSRDAERADNIIGLLEREVRTTQLRLEGMQKLIVDLKSLNHRLR